MTERKDDGGNAFPMPPYNPGMGLRDWFAGQALSGMLQNMERLRLIVRPTMSQEEADAAISKQAYAHADALLAERAKK